MASQAKMTAQERIRVLLVDNYPIVREGLRARLRAQEEMELVGEAAGGEEVVRQALESVPDLVVMDIELPEVDGLELTRVLRQKIPQAKVLLFTARSDRDHILEAIRAGARGYLLKTVSVEELFRAMKAVHRGEIFFPPEVLELIAREVPEERRARDRSQLTKREREVLVLIAQGCTNREIAQRLSLSARTIETHRHHIIRKLNIHTAAGLTRYAIAQGLVSRV